MTESVEVTKLGRTLLLNAPEEMREMVLRSSCKNLYNALQRVNAKPREIKKFDVDSAILILQEVTDPDVLTQISLCDNRSNLRYHIHRHPVATELIGTPVKMVVKKQTTELLAGEPEKVLDTILSTPRIDAVQVLAWARALTGDNKKVAYEKLVRYGNVLQVALLRDIHAGKVADLNLRALFERTGYWDDDWGRRRVLNNLLSHWPVPLDKALAELAVQYKATLSNAKVDSAAAHILAESGELEHLQKAMLSGFLSEDEIFNMFQKVDVKYRASLLVSAENEDLADRLALNLHYRNTGPSYSQDPMLLLSYKWRGLHPVSRMNILSYAYVGEVLEWAAGKYVNVPREGEGHLLIETLRKGDCNTRLDSAFFQNFNRNANLDNAIIREMWENLYEKTPGITQVLLSYTAQGACTRDVVGKFIAEFGDDATYWEMLATLLPEWHGTIPELFETIKLVTL